MSLGIIILFESALTIIRMSMLLGFNKIYASFLIENCN